MKEIITHSPIQVRPTTNITHERLLSMLSAESANRLLESLGDQDRTRLDVWNTYLKHPEYDTLRPEDRDKLIGENIDARYSVLSENYQIRREDRLIIRDDQESYIGVLKKIILRLVEDRTMIVKPEDFHVCKKCSFIIAPKGAKITACPDCQATDLGTATMNGMFLNVDTGRMSEFETRDFDVLSAEGRNRVKSAMLTMPLVVSAVKHRGYGVSLEEFGVSPEFKLDPKISIALSGAVTRESGIGEVGISIQGIDSLKNQVPFTLLLDPDTKTKFLNIGMVPTFSTPELEKYGSLFYFPYLALVIAGKSKKISGDEIQSLLKQFDHTRSKLSSCIQFLKKTTEMYAEGNVIPAKDEINKLADALREDLKDGKFKHAVEAMHGFIFDWISRVYINQCKTANSKLDPELLQHIEKILLPIFQK